MTDTCCPGHWCLPNGVTKNSKGAQQAHSVSVSLWPFCYKIPKQNFMMPPKSSRPSGDILVPVITPGGGGKKWVLGEWARHIPMCALIAPPPPWGDTALTHVLSVLCREASQVLRQIPSPSPTSSAWLCVFSLRAFESKHFYKVKFVPMSAPFQSLPVNRDQVISIVHIYPPPLLKKIKFLLPLRSQPREFSG